jgi:hypothetical protein
VGQPGDGEGLPDVRVEAILAGQDQRVDHAPGARIESLEPSLDGVPQSRDPSGETHRSIGRRDPVREEEDPGGAPSLIGQAPATRGIHRPSRLDRRAPPRQDHANDARAAHLEPGEGEGGGAATRPGAGGEVAPYRDGLAVPNRSQTIGGGGPPDEAARGPPGQDGAEDRQREPWAPPCMNGQEKRGEKKGGQLDRPGRGLGRNGAGRVGQRQPNHRRHAGDHTAP